ncbi:MAG: P-loop NTPase [Deltaproteobacteria bacterium]|nr:P-loop NTPase [Deltaproteobacteria bacterium]
MGVFHCPFGCPYYEDEGCIDCGLCNATTEEEMVEASKKVRAYLKANAIQGRPIQKIAVCGKGGTGKSTIVTLMAKALAGLNYSVLALDTDESNPGLYRSLGFEKTPKPLTALMNRFSYREQPEEDTYWIMHPEITTADIPPQFIPSQNGIKFMMVGKIEDPFQGCACSISDVTRSFVLRLQLMENEILLIDTEAGIESFGRGVERSVDLVLSVVEPSFEAMALAEKIVFMAEGMGINRAGAILNKVPSQDIKEKMVRELQKRNVQTLGTVYFDQEVQEAGFEGRPPVNSKAGKEVEGITQLLINIVQQTTGNK